MRVTILWLPKNRPNIGLDLCLYRGIIVFWIIIFFKLIFFIVEVSEAKLRESAEASAGSASAPATPTGTTERKNSKLFSKLKKSSSTSSSAPASPAQVSCVVRRAAPRVTSSAQKGSRQMAPPFRCVCQQTYSAVRLEPKFSQNFKKQPYYKIVVFLLPLFVGIFFGITIVHSFISPQKLGDWNEIIT